MYYSMPGVKYIDKSNNFVWCQLEIEFFVYWYMCLFLYLSSSFVLILVFIEIFVFIIVFIEIINTWINFSEFKHHYMNRYKAKQMNTKLVLALSLGSGFLHGSWQYLCCIISNTCRKVWSNSGLLIMVHEDTHQVVLF